MVDLSIGYVAGMVAAGFFVGSTVAANAFAQSHWSYLVLSDSFYGDGVSKGVLWAARLIPLTAILFAVGSVVTPLGLYSTLIQDEPVVAQFTYIPDPSSFGYGTSPRQGYELARTCGTGSPQMLPCPFTDTVVIEERWPNGTIQWTFPYNYNTSIPSFLRKTFGSGTPSTSTISNYFDIQWRRFSFRRDPYIMNGSAVVYPDPASIQNLVLDNKLSAVEGLVVDMIEGGVGFRNHTIPTGFQRGVEWDEDLLFVEPESVCVDTNLTIDWTIKGDGYNLIPAGGVVLTDRGGFFNLNRTYPRISLGETQKNPRLYERAYQAAWLHNAYAAVYFNITNPGNSTTGEKAFQYFHSEINQTWSIDISGYFDSGGTSRPVTDLTTPGLDSLTLSLEFGQYLNAARNIANRSTINPWNITDEDWIDMRIQCGGAGSGDKANITNILVGCGQLRSVPHRSNPGNPTVFDDGSSWTQKIYVCASAVKATVKTVSMSYNGTDVRFDSLNITSTKDKTYLDEKSMPLWGVENINNRLKLTEMKLLWGILSDAYATKPNVSAVRQRSLYLPGFIDYRLRSENYRAYGNDGNLPGTDFSTAALMAAYSVSTSSLGSLSLGKLQDYTGVKNLALWKRWQNLSGDASTAALIPNLIFTDVAASSVVGTKGALGPGNAGTPGAYPFISVTPVKERVRFNLPYGIPAFLSALLLLLIVSVALAAAIIGDHGYSRLRRQMQETAVGRVYTTFLYPSPGVLRAKSKDWNEHLGDKVVDLSGDYPAVEETLIPSSDEKDPGEVSLAEPLYQSDQTAYPLQQPPYQYQPERPVYYPGLEGLNPSSSQQFQNYDGSYIGAVSPPSAHTPGLQDEKSQGSYPGLPYGD
ncbi:hypothetical protein GQ53DRAFT_840793 [Thozetella sp. PMI_491]|nr:hypothetical protein GQ53DRAFT_840793 [Thozetella sp. PMI_491]